MSLATRVLLGLVLGIAVGLFFGPRVAFLGVVGDAFVRLLQMTVLPYIVTSLVPALGSLSVAEAVRLARTAGALLLLFWGLALATVLVAPLAYPDWPAASFFSHTLVEGAAPVNLVDLYIPANPFESLADTIIPAVVFFTLVLGIALIAVPGKEPVLRALRTLSQALSAVMNFVIRLAPLGVFAIAAKAAGTMDVGELQGIQVYVATFALGALLLALWTLPGLVVAFTPLRYADVFRAGRAAFITAFATGSVFVVLAVLAVRAKELVREAGASQEIPTVDVVVPTAFNLPSAGKLLALSFVPFAGWMSGFGLSAGQLPSFVATGLASFVGSTFVAIPFLLDLFRVPADTFRLFVIADQVVGNRFGALVASVHILVLTLLAACALAGRVRVTLRGVLVYVAITVLLTGGGFLGIRLLFGLRDHPYDTYKLFVERDLLVQPVASRLWDGAPPSPAPEASASAVDRALARKRLRVGIFPDSLPFAFVNQESRLVGFDVEMAHHLARDLGVELEFVRLPRDEGFALLDRGQLDVLMSGLVVTPQRLLLASASEPYLEETLAFVVPDYDRERFASGDRVRALAAPRIAVPDLPYFVEALRRYLPQAELVSVASPRAFFRAGPDEFDALLLTAERGASWSLIHPEYSVVVPQPDVVTVPLAYFVRRGDEATVAFLNGWLALKRRDGTLDRLFAYWVQGQTPPEKAEPRWSIARDVLGWID